MDIEIRIGCSKCTKEYFMSWDTHNTEHSDRLAMIGGMCPFCNNYNTAIMEQDEIGVYNPIQDNVTEVPYYAG